MNRLWESPICTRMWWADNRTGQARHTIRSQDGPRCGCCCEEWRRGGNWVCARARALVTAVCGGNALAAAGTRAAVDLHVHYCLNQLQAGTIPLDLDCGSAWQRAGGGHLVGEEARPTRRRRSHFHQHRQPGPRTRVCSDGQMLARGIALAPHQTRRTRVGQVAKLALALVSSAAMPVAACGRSYRRMRHPFHTILLQPSHTPSPSSARPSVRSLRRLRRLSSCCCCSSPGAGSRPD